MIKKRIIFDDVKLSEKEINEIKMKEGIRDMILKLCDIVQEEQEKLARLKKKPNIFN